MIVLQFRHESSSQRNEFQPIEVSYKSALQNNTENGKEKTATRAYQSHTEAFKVTHCSRESLPLSKVGKIKK
jgi:hypothetical protein